MTIRTKVELTQWQIAQLERLTENQVGQLRHDGLEGHAVTKSMIELLRVLQEAGLDQPTSRKHDR